MINITDEKPKLMHYKLSVLLLFVAYFIFIMGAYVEDFFGSDTSGLMLTFSVGFVFLLGIFSLFIFRVLNNNIIMTITLYVADLFLLLSLYFLVGNMLIDNFVSEGYLLLSIWLLSSIAGVLGLFIGIIVSIVNKVKSKKINENPRI